MNRKPEAFLYTRILVLLVIFGIQLFSARTALAQNGDIYNPIGYTLLGETSHVSGAITDSSYKDAAYMSFRSYFSGTNVSNLADNNASNMDFSSDKGTHGNFTGQQYGPDSIYDTLAEENTAEGVSNATLIDVESFEGIWPPTGWIETGAWNRESSQAYDGIYSADFDGPAFGSGSGDLDTPDLNCSDATAIYVSFYFREAVGLVDEFRLRFWNGFTWVNIEDLGGYSLGWHLWEMKVTDSQYFISDFRIRWVANALESGESVYVDLVTVKKETPAADNYELDLEIQWTNTDYDEANEELAIYVYKGNNTHSLDAASGYMIIGDGTPDWGSTTGTISFWIKMDTSVQGRFWGQDGTMETRWSGTNLVLDWGAADSMVSAYSFSADTWYFIAIVWDENNNNLFLYVGDENNGPTIDSNSLTGTWTSTTPPPIENRFMNGLGGSEPVDGHGDDLRYWNVSRSLTEIQSDYDVELTGSEHNLRSYFKLNGNFDDIGLDNNDGSGSGNYSFSSDVSFDAPPTENIRVDAWNGTTWQNLFTNLTNGWNNISISSFLDSPTFTIRFKGGIETGDDTQDSWSIDSTLLHIWSNKYTAEVEFTGSCNQGDWSQLTWTIVSAWTTSSVNVSLQLYNYTLGNYSSNENGCLSYISSALPEEDETGNQTVTVSPTHFRNDTGYWKVKIRGVKATDSQFELKVDLIKYEVASMASPDVAVLGVTVSSTSVYAGEVVTITVTVRNDGGTTENFNVTAYYNNTQIGRKPVSNLASSANTTIEFSWNTTNVSAGTYTIEATADTIPGEMNITNNTYVYGTVKIDIQTPPQPFDWMPIFYTLVVLGALLPLAIVLKRKRIADKPTAPRHSFLEQSGMTRQQMVGRKILLEVDPTSSYYKALFSLVSEAITNGESLFIFTSKNSALHTAFSGENAKFFFLTTKISSLKRINKKEVLVPASDLSVLLDTFAKISKKKTRRPMTILFDNVSDTILMCGFEKTYKFMRFLLETVSSPKVTALFIFNPTAHNPSISSSVRGLFQFRLVDLKTKSRLKL